MASMDVSLYDYNGSIWAFGVISGYSTVTGVRMYVSNGRGTTYQYYSNEIYDKDLARINTTAYPAPVFLFFLRTDKHTREGDSPAQLPYNVVDPEDSNGRGRYKISFDFLNGNTNLGNHTITANGNRNSWFQMHHSLSTPSATYNEETRQLTVTGCGAYRCNVRITRTNRNKVYTAFPPEVKDYAYKINMQSYEGTMGGKYTENIPPWQADWDNITPDGPDIECKYQRGETRYGAKTTAIVLFDSGAHFTNDEVSAYMTTVNNAFAMLESYTQMTFQVDHQTWSEYTSDPYETVDIMQSNYGCNSDLDYDFCIRIGNNVSMASIESGYQGFWNFYTSSNWRENYSTPETPANWCGSNATINIDRAKENESVAHVICEEIYQSMNIGVDCFDYPLSIHWDPHYSNPGTYAIEDPYHDNICWDREALKFFWSAHLEGKTPFELINEFDTPCCLAMDGSSSTRVFDLSQLASDKYNVEVWLCDEGEYEPGGGTWSNGVQDGGSVSGSHYNWNGGWDDAPYSLHTSLEIQTSTRPDPFKWDTPKEKGEAYKLTADEWNRFQQHIKVIAQYKNVSLTKTFTDVQPGQEVDADIYNNARAAIQELPNNAGYYIPYVSRKTQITADTTSLDQTKNNINKIVDEINEVD